MRSDRTNKKLDIYELFIQGANGMGKISDILEKVTKLLLIVFVTLLVVSTTLQVISRFILKEPIIWTGELTHISFIWMALLGASLATKYKDHLGIDIANQKLTGRVRKGLQILIHILMIVVAVIFIVGGWTFVEKNVGRISITTGLPMYYLYISAPISGILMLFYLTEQLPSIIKEGAK